MRLRTSGTDNSNALYYMVAYTLLNGGAAGTVNNATQTAWTIGSLDNFPILGGFTMDLLSPQATDYTTMLIHAQLADPAFGVMQQFRVGSGQFYGTTSFDAFSLISSVASSISGEYRVYGYQNS
jgi:hypothetical protein